MVIITAFLLLFFVDIYSRSLRILREVYRVSINDPVLV